MALAPTLKLYHCCGARSMRVLWTIKEMGLREYELTTLPFPPRFLHREFLKINPLGTVPFVADGTTGLTESCAAPLYIAQKWGAPAGSPAAMGSLLLAPDEPDYGAFLNWLFHADATLTFPQTVMLLGSSRV